SAFLLLLFLILFILSENFSFLFGRFHLAFFPQGNYSFPEDSLLISMFPLRFFKDYFISMVICSGTISLVSLISGTALAIIPGAKLKKESQGDSITNY
ncbi:MAG: hypothetical protein JW770_07185, partial [Actinobacteria bacterium]|nr:hypothetical protein [Actinomycetota bacterium]